MKKDLIGLSLSGGGIRSATFNLGVIQAFAREHLLSHVDYLSTVSGGGYIGSWLSSWVYRRCRSGTFGPNHIAQIESELNRKPKNVEDKAEPDQIRFLRQYSNYLAPRLGTLSGDTLAFVGVYIRNLLLNQIILVAFAFALLGIPWILGLTIPWILYYVIPQCLGLVLEGDSKWVFCGTLFVTMASALVLLLWVLCSISRNINESIARIGRREERENVSCTPHDKDKSLGDSPAKVLWCIAVPEFSFCALLTISVWYCVNPGSSIIRWVPDWFSKLISTVSSLIPFSPVWLIVPVTAVVYTIFWFISAFNTLIFDSSGQGKSCWENLRWAPTRRAFFAGWVAGVFVVLGAKFMTGWPAWYLLTFGIPMGVLLVLAVGCIHLGLIGRAYYDGLREWWARLGGYILAIVVCWFVFCLTALFVPPWWKSLWHVLTLAPTDPWFHKLWKAMGTLGITGAIGGWFTVTFRGLFIAKGPNVGGEVNITSVPHPRKELLALLAPPFFVLGLMVLLSMIILSITEALSHPWPGYIALSYDIYWSKEALTWDLLKICLFAASMLILSLVLGQRVDVNEFSLHNAYRNRLVRCYLGATHRNRKGQPFTGFDEDDNFSLHHLNGLGAPFHILNATLNASKGNDLALQARKAYSFVFTPLYSGFEYTKNAVGAQTRNVRGFYRLSKEYSNNARPYSGASLGTAMAISGAALSPNMGFHTDPAVAFLLTVFSVRLGWWSGNPMKREAWESGYPRSSWRALMNELTGRTTEESDVVYLSDGGHFDNLGVYELVRRRCRLIIACDAGQDSTCSCADLARVAEKCRVDFGAEIIIDLNELQPTEHLFPGDATMRVSKSAFCKGTIRYGDGHSGELIYIKPCLDTKLSQDVIAYARTHATFPHQSTADQFFDEAQFESYRALGYACASAAVPSVASAMLIGAQGCVGSDE
jgi:hypothetical protein